MLYWKLSTVFLEIVLWLSADILKCFIGILTCFSNNKNNKIYLVSTSGGVETDDTSIKYAVESILKCPNFHPRQWNKLVQEFNKKDNKYTQDDPEVCEKN